ncbi:hypothetical protein MMA231_00948 [Asticcacaulis sp. MM231]|uniref:hypothetical protein n=1 Tax=Asticcacaulis sp. MM231 TaxID=3157666 RepID=UPI0032D582D2
MAKPFKFKQRTIQMPWSESCRAWFDLHEDEESPAFYSVIIQLKKLTYTCSVKGKDGWRNHYNMSSANFLNLEILKAHQS